VNENGSEMKVECST